MSSSHVPLPPDLAGIQLRPRRAERDDASPGGTARESASAAEQRGHTSVVLADVKDLQRRAFERGREVERHESGDLLRSAGAALAAEARRLRAAREGDRAGLRDFAVKLACSIAEELTCSLVDEDRHDVRGMVDRILAEVLPDMTDDEIRLHGHPDDVGRLSLHFERSDATPMVRLVPDQRMKKGDFRVRGGEVEFYAGVQERLLAVRERLLEGIREPHAP